MFLLHEELPTSITVDGLEYKLDMAFDNVLKMYDMLNDKELADHEQIELGIRMLFLEIPEVSDAELFNIWKTTFETLFADEIQKPQLDIKGNPMPSKKNDSEKYMDLKQDAKFIYASFLQDYNIDLFEQQGKLHWYKFKSLLDGLSDKTMMSKVMNIRKMEMPKGKGQEKARKEIKAAKDYYALKGDEEEDGG